MFYSPRNKNKLCKAEQAIQNYLGDPPWYMYDFTPLIIEHYHYRIDVPTLTYRYHINRWNNDKIHEIAFDDKTFTSKIRWDNFNIYTYAGKDIKRAPVHWRIVYHEIYVPYFNYLMPLSDSEQKIIHKELKKAHRINKYIINRRKYNKALRI